MQLRPILGALSLGSLVVCFFACSSESDSTAASGNTFPGGGSGGAAGAGASAGTGASGQGGSGGRLIGSGGAGTGCTDCDEGVCLGGECCPTAQVCAQACCGTAQVCSFGKCEDPGTTCVDATECPTGSYCDYSLGENTGSGGAAGSGGTGGSGSSCVGGVTLQTGRCLPKPPECAPGVEPGPSEELTCLAACEYRPPTAAFAPEVKYHWDKGDIMMAPIVLQLDDDNCDGVVDERDIPEIVFSTFAGGRYQYDGTLWAISMVSGQVVEKWSFKHADKPVYPGGSLAGGDIDGLPGNEIVACSRVPIGGVPANGYTHSVSAIKADGSELWTTDVPYCWMPSIGDLDQDGKPEVVIEGVILDGASGAIEATLDPPNTANVVLSDMTGDGLLDIVSPTRLYDGAGQLIVDTGLSGTYVAIGDFDKDGVPEAASIDRPTHLLNVWRYDASAAGLFEIVRSGIDINGTFPNNCPVGSAGSTAGGGPPTVADFNGDGTPDVSVAGGIGYTVIDGTKILDGSVAANETNLWLQQTRDCSSAATGSSVFDFNGDGKAEVVYADEQYLRVYDGTDGLVLFQTCNTSGTLWEYPLVADVDNDGNADLIVIANSYSSLSCPDDGSKQRGVRVFGDNQGNWVRTRRIWNQHAYHVTNVAEDGSIPMMEQPNWTTPRLNNFRQNVQPLGEFSAPDLVVQVLHQCFGDYGLIGRVRNVGTASVPPGVVVGFYEGDPAAGGTALGTLSTTRTLYPAEAEDLFLVLPNATDLEAGTSEAFAVADDGSPAHAWHECREDNNKSEGSRAECDGVPR